MLFEPLSFGKKLLIDNYMSIDNQSVISIHIVFIENFQIDSADLDWKPVVIYIVMYLQAVCTTAPNDCFLKQILTRKLN